MGLQREREGIRVLMCVLMWGKKPDKEHADPQSWLQSSPDKSVLRHTVMYPRAGSAEAATRTKAKPPDKSYQQTKGDLLMHDMGFADNVSVLHSMSCIILCESESQFPQLNTEFLQNVFQILFKTSHVCRHVHSLRNINVFLTASAIVSCKSSFCAPVFWRLHYCRVLYSNTLTLCWCWWVKARGGDEQCRGKWFCGVHQKGLETCAGGDMCIRLIHTQGHLRAVTKHKTHQPTLVRTNP